MSFGGLANVPLPAKSYLELASSAASRVKKAALFFKLPISYKVSYFINTCLVVVLSCIFVPEWNGFLKNP
ncbi:MAG: hypothetical protein K0R98_2051 [Rickettsiaceae bacterium]|nr:hypothetical protein [Rickettsiaceae bacterium]